MHKEAASCMCVPIFLGNGGILRVKSREAFPRKPRKWGVFRNLPMLTNTRDRCFFFSRDRVFRSPLHKSFTREKTLVKSSDSMGVGEGDSGHVYFIESEGGGVGGEGTLYKCQYGDVPLTWVWYPAISVHSWVANSPIIAKTEYEVV